MKKNILIFFLLLLTASCVWFFFIQKKYRTPFSTIQPFEAIPTNAAVILEFDDYFSFRHAMSKMPYSEEMSEVFFAEKISQDFKYIRKLFSKNKNHRKLLIENSITASMHLTGQLDVDFLYIMHDERKVFSLKKILEKVKARESVSNGITVYRIEVEDGKNYTIAFYKKILLISKHSYLVEQGMIQLKDPTTNLLTNSEFNFSKNKKDSDSQIRVHFLFENFKALAHPFFREGTPDFFKFFSENISSAQFDFDFKKEGVQINGKLNPVNGNTLLQNIFYNNKPTISQTPNILPQNVAYFFRQSLANTDLENQSSELFEKYFLPWLGEEWLVGRTEVFTRKMNAEKFVAFQLKDLKTAQHHLEKLSNEEGTLNAYEYQTYSIQQLVLAKIPIPFSATEEMEIKNPFYTIIGDYVVFAGSGKVLENWIDSFLTGQNLASNTSFLKMKNKAGKNEFLEFYWNNQAAYRFLKKTFIKDENGSSAQLKIWEHFPAFGLNGKLEKGKLITNGFLFFQKEIEKRTEVKWRATLQAEAITPPATLYNDEKGDHNVFIQDENNRLYMFNAEGEEVWSKMLEQKVLSKFWAADFSENENRLILFNTENKIHLIDFEGNVQKEFPLELSSPASNGLMLAKFNETEFGIFLACENGLIYGYDQDGIPLSGWNSVEVKGKFTQPFNHVQTSQYDFIVMQNENGDVFSFGKNGSTKMSVSSISNKSTAPLCFQSEENNLVIADQNGEPVLLDLLGGAIEVSEKVIVQNNKYLFSSADFGGSNRTDFAIIKNKELQIFYDHQNEFQEYGKFTFTSQPDAVFSVRSKNMGKSRLGALCKSQNQIYFFDKKGKLHPDFPLAGSTTFELVNLFSEDKNAVVVADKNQVVVYEIP